MSDLAPEDGDAASTCYDKASGLALYILSARVGILTDGASLAALMYQADLTHYADHAVSISGCRYVAAESGPEPFGFAGMLDRMIADGKVSRGGVPA